LGDLFVEYEFESLKVCPSLLKLW